MAERKLDLLEWRLATAGELGEGAVVGRAARIPAEAIRIGGHDVGDGVRSQQPPILDSRSCWLGGSKASGRNVAGARLEFDSLAQMFDKISATGTVDQAECSARRILFCDRTATRSSV